MMSSLARDLRRVVNPVAAIPHTALTAGGAGDATAINGTTINVLAIKKPVPGSDVQNVRAESALFVVTATATLAATKSLVLTSKVQTSPDGSTWTDISTLMPSGVGKPTDIHTVTSAGGGTVQTVQTLSVPLEYMNGGSLRLVVTPNLDATGTDVAQVQAVALLAGLAAA